MPNFLTPYPPTLSPASESQALSGSSLSSNLTSNSSSNYFDRVSRDSSGSAYLTDVTPPPITPSHTNYDREHGKPPHDDSISSDPLIGPFKKLFESRILRERRTFDSGDDAGYTTDCEQENTPLLDAVDAVQARLKLAEPTVNTQRALKIMEEHTNTVSNALDLLDEPLLAPSMPAMKVVVTKAEEGIEDWTGEFEISKSNIETTIPSPLSEVAGPTPTQNVPFPINKDQIWQCYSANEFERAFHEGLAEDVGRSFFPDEIKLHPADTFAFGTGNIPGWREEPTSVSDVPILQSALSPPIPDTPVLRPLDESWEASSLVLNSPSLVFDSSMSISQMLISPQNLDAGAIASSPGVLDISFNNPNFPLNSPLMAISTLMFASRRTQLPLGDVLHGVQNLDFPALMRLEIAATLAAQQQQNTATSLAEDRPLPLAGLGLEITPSQLPESSFPSCNSLPSIYSLPSWDPRSAPTHSTPPCEVSEITETTASFVTAASGDEDLEDIDQMVDDFIINPRTALSDIAEESSCALALATAESSKQIVGLGLGALAESTLQSSASISRLRSPEQPPVAGTLAGMGLSASMNLTDMVGPYQGAVDYVDHHSYSVIESSGIFDGQSHLSMVSDNGSASFISGIEPSGVLPDGPFLEAWHYSPGVENWLLFCSEVEPLAPLEMEIISDSPAALTVNLEQGYCRHSEIEPSGVLSARPIMSACSIDRRSMSAILNSSVPQDVWHPPHAVGAPRLRRQSHLRHSFVASDLERGELDPRSPVSPARPLVPTLSRDVASSSRPAVGTAPSPDFGVEVASCTLPDSASLVSCAPLAERSSLKSSKSAEGLGLGLPSDRASLPPRQREVTSSGLDTASLMSSAEECLDLSALAAASPTSSSGSPNVMVSEERAGSRFFFKIPRFAKRSLYTIPEAVSPPSPASASASASASPRGRLLSAAWSDLTSRLRSPGKSSGTSRFLATPRPTSPLAGSSGDAPECPAPTAIAAPTPLSAPPSTSCLPQPPRLEPRQPHASWLARLSRGSLSPAAPQDAGVRSPGMTEHLDAPRNTLGVLERMAGDPVQGRRAGRFTPVVRKLQMLF